MDVAAAGIDCPGWSTPGLHVVNWNQQRAEGKFLHRNVALRSQENDWRLFMSLLHVCRAAGGRLEKSSGRFYHTHTALEHREGYRRRIGTAKRTHKVLRYCIPKTLTIAFGYP